MSTTAQPGPGSVEGIKPPTIVGPVPPVPNAPQPAIVNENPDFAPSMAYGGWGSLRDPRWLQHIAAGAVVAGGYPGQDVGFFMSTGGLVLTDQVPTVATAGALAAAQAATSGTSLTLVTVSGNGVHYNAAALALPYPLGVTIPAGSLAMESNGGYVGGGSSGAFQFLDPTKSLARAVSVTANGGATGGAIVVHGYDVFGQAMSESITAAAGTTVAGKKAFKYVVSAIPAFTDAGHTYSLDTADVFGIHIRVDRFAYVRAFFNDVAVVVAAFTAADATSPATTTTGDTRGTLAETSDTTKRLQIFAMPSAGNMIAATPGAAITGMFGIQQA